MDIADSVTAVYSAGRRIYFELAVGDRRLYLPFDLKEGRWEDVATSLPDAAALLGRCRQAVRFLEAVERYALTGEARVTKGSAVDAFIKTVETGVLHLIG